MRYGQQAARLATSILTIMTAMPSATVSAALLGPKAIGEHAAKSSDVIDVRAVVQGAARVAEPWFIAAGAAIGFVTAASAAAWAGAAPAAGMCWYYTDPSRTQGFWDYCP